MKIVFAHVRNYSNSGDMACCPYQYFKSFFDQFECKFLDISDAFPWQPELVTEDDCVIIGGGGLDGYHNTWHKRINQLTETAKISVAWGLGTNINEHNQNVIEDQIDYDNFDIVGVRDYAETLRRYVPCVSCLHEEFTKPHTKRRRVGCIIHKDAPININCLPKNCDIITNAHNLRGILRFIAESEEIYSNSYHANYWSALFGTECHRIGRSKDSRFDLSEFINGVDEGFYGRCVDRNIKFFEDVKTIIELENKE